MQFSGISTWLKNSLFANLVSLILLWPGEMKITASDRKKSELESIISKKYCLFSGNSLQIALHVFALGSLIYAYLLGI